MFPSDTACGNAILREEIEAGFKLLGDFWTLSIIDSLCQQEEQRFCGLQRNIGGVNPVTLVSRLKKLEEFGLIVRHTETLDKLSVTYSLTAKGRDILPVIDSIRAFSDRHYTAKKPKTARIKHAV